MLSGIRVVGSPRLGYVSFFTITSLAKVRIFKRYKDEIISPRVILNLSNGEAVGFYETYEFRGLCEGPRNSKRQDRGQKIEKRRNARIAIIVKSLNSLKTSRGISVIIRYLVEQEM